MRAAHGGGAVEITDPRSENPNLFGNRQWTLSFQGGVRS